jgi:hypothetical protein
MAARASTTRPPGTLKAATLFFVQLRAFMAHHDLLMKLAISA